MEMIKNTVGVGGKKCNYVVALRTCIILLLGLFGKFFFTCRNLWGNCQIILIFIIQENERAGFRWRVRCGCNVSTSVVNVK